MATIALAGRSFEIAPLKLGEMRKVAKHIDAVNATAGSLTTFEGMLQSARDQIEVLSLALRKTDLTLTADALEDLIGMEDIAQLSEAFIILLSISGMTAKGEAPAASEPVMEGPSTTSSDALSSS